MPGPGGELVIVITEAHVANDRPYQGTQNNKSDVTMPESSSVFFQVS